MAKRIICRIIYVHYKHVICFQAYSFVTTLVLEQLKNMKSNVLDIYICSLKKEIIEHIADLGLKCQLRLHSVDKDTVSHLGCFNHALLQGLKLGMHLSSTCSMQSSELCIQNTFRYCICTAAILLEG